MTTQQILEKLVSFPVLGGDTNLEIINWIQQYIESFGVTTFLVYNNDNTKASLHCRIGPAVGGGVILSGHTDVVPVKNQPWDTNPFELVEKADGNLYARGSCDMKGFLACCLATLPKMVKANLTKPIYFAFSYDEEIGCLGAEDLINDIKSTYSEIPKFAIIGEATMLQPIIGQKSIHILDITVNGSEGHSSRINQEVSAIHEAAKIVLWAETKMEKLVKTSNDVRFNPPHSSLHVGTINGGIAANIIANNVTLSLDMRCLPKDNPNKLHQDLINFCKERETIKRAIFSNFTIKVEENHRIVPAFSTHESSEAVTLIGEITGNYNWNTVSYASEAGYFANAGFEAIICGPGSIKQAHRANEFISKDQLNKGTAMIEALVTYLEK
ncbi:acetylornithine deacetylase [Tamlana nanhaiensis]|uniref:Acetylornithine deacetylase n=1 Tax=Neotamlana nanhaiensis TaxID=1382798 RepID=A0A0D7VZ38_9FLAO|nr:acetylornithine deacetylase [Tamlana nanhaiensis]KJD32054.1 acetylornithine deacetylase [Tamlana nanhaiensis]KJD32216.1 acetylornithine deacetylase [Tamlana nanhaiensis]